MWSIIKKIKINPFFWFILGIGIITGYFKEVVMVFAIVFIHEMGHALVANHFNWRIRKIELLPFGGVAEMDESGNRPFREEFLVIIAGPLQHLWLMGASFAFVSFDFWSTADHQQFILHNLMILGFNLIPVWPLDGGKLVHLGYCYLFAYQRAQALTLYSSIGVLALVSLLSYIMFPFHLNLWVVLFFLCISNYLEWKQRHYAYMRFLMDRLNGKMTYSRRQHLTFPNDMKIRDVLKKFRKGHNHIIVIKDTSKKTFIEEIEILQTYFHDKKINHTLQDITKGR
ncbi:M50 family metallopeptidase [Bacillus alkalicellulosilyticus]|uniref:M50 family metallopeptidase n=1 Tax=Alkalihalobacterium alkalicellulosilyticum TaxID=1912214 RepID=UPI001FE72ACD|nr:M50 family metallopeptidase [Bacillus alkalicellulosilyticus]